MKYKKHLLILLFIIFFQINISAHPHMAIYSSCEFVFENNEATGLWLNYKFDKYFTVDILNSYDLNKDSSFNDSETEQVYQNAFINLENFGFFISIRDKNGRTSPDRVQNFSAHIENDMIIYRFFISLDQMIDDEIFLSMYDPTFFCIIYYEETSPVVISGDFPAETSFSIIKNTDFPIHYNPNAPSTDSKSYDSWQPGLQTYFPEEIHLVY